MACQLRRCEYVGLEPTKTTQPPLVVLDHVIFAQGDYRPGRVAGLPESILILTSRGKYAPH